MDDASAMLFGFIAMLTIGVWGLGIHLSDRRDERTKKRALAILNEAYATGDYSKCFTKKIRKEERERGIDRCEEFLKKHGRYMPGDCGPVEVGEGKFLISRTTYRKSKYGYAVADSVHYEY